MGVVAEAAAEHLANLTTVIVDGARAGRRRLALQREAFDLAALASALAQSLAARAAAKGLTARHIDLADSAAARRGGRSGAPARGGRKPASTMR